MFVLRNAWAALLRRKWRTLCAIIVALVVTLISVFTLAVAQANSTAQGSSYQALKPTAELRMTDAAQTKRNGTDSAWTKNYLTWKQYTTYATAAQNAGIAFSYSLEESIPVRQTDKFKAVVGSADQSSDKTGGELTFSSFYTKEAESVNDSGTLKIVKGKALSYDSSSATSSTTSNNNRYLVGYTPYYNHLDVNDSISVATPNDASKTQSFKIQGIYTYTDAAVAGSGSDAKLAKDNRDNTIYTNYAVFSNAGFDPDAAKGWAVPNLNIIFILSSMSDYTKFASAVNKAKLPTNYQVASPTIDRYNASVAPLKQLDGLTEPYLIAVWIAGGALLLILTVLGLVRRRGEFGHALVIGVSKGRLAWQLMLEVLLPLLAALAVGVAIAGFATGPLATKLAAGNAVSVNLGILGGVAGWGFASALLLAIVASLWASTFRISALFAAPQEVRS